MVKILKYSELINRLENKGVKFEIINKDDAEHFLVEHNYYVKLASYRFNFNKNNHGKYVGLDFFHLKELSILDMHLKFLILNTCLNIEHSLKVNLLNDITEKNLDDFDLVRDFNKNYPRCLNNIRDHRNTGYCKYLLNKYDHPNYPIWVVFETMSFGELVKFYEFYTQNYSELPLDYRLLYNVKDIRNACAHSNCLMHNLGNKRNTPNQYLRNFIIQNVDLGKGTINNKLRNKSIHDFIAMLYVLDLITKSQEIKMHRLNDFETFFENRMIREKEHFRQNNLLISSYDFIKKVLDFFSQDSKI